MPYAGGSPPRPGPPPAPRPPAAPPVARSSGMPPPPRPPIPPPGLACAAPPGSLGRAWSAATGRRGRWNRACRSRAPSAAAHAAASRLSGAIAAAGHFHVEAVGDVHGSVGGAPVRRIETPEAIFTPEDGVLD